MSQQTCLMIWKKKTCGKMCSVPVFYFVYNMANYYHFVYDTLPYLYGYFNEKKVHPDMKLLVSPPDGKDDLYPFVWESLELLGIKRQDVIFLDTDTVYDRVCIGSSLTHNGLSNCPPHQGVFDILNSMKMIILVLKKSISQGELGLIVMCLILELITQNVVSV